MSDKLSFSGGGPSRFRSGVVIASGDFKSADPPAVTIDTHGAHCLRVNTNPTALSGSGCTVTVLIEALDGDGVTWYTLLSKAITATGVTSQLVGSSIVASAGVALNAPLPKKVRVTCTGSGTRTTLTYGVTAEVS